MKNDLVQMARRHPVLAVAGLGAVGLLVGRAFRNIAEAPTLSSGRDLSSEERPEKRAKHPQEPRGTIAEEALSESAWARRRGEPTDKALL